jgi:transcriptional regulator with XRE-family HTH domain
MLPPTPPPEAVLIRLVREAAGLKLPAVARLAGISKARWSQIETGYETRAGSYRQVKGRAVTVAHMAHAIGLAPERLATEGNRPDAAAVLREILHHPQPPPPLEVIHSGNGGQAPASAVEEFMTDPAVPDGMKEAVAAWITVLRKGQDRAENGA